MKNTRKIAFLSVLAALGLTGCAGEKPTPPVANTTSTPTVSPTPAANAANKVESETKKKGHEHKAPNGGTLVVLGEEFVHIEFVLNAETGSLTAYVLDGEAEKSVRVTQTELALKIEKPFKGTIKLSAVENSLTGEKSGDTSEFRGQSDQLKSLRDFDAEIETAKVKGKEFKDVHFNFPKGNEADHKH